jgi:hypothetical protein
MTPQEFAQSVQNLSSNIDAELEKVEIGALKTLEGDMKTRVHNKGLDSFGRSMGGYSKAWAKVRKEADKKTNKKDLEFTSTLRENIILGTSEGKNVLGYLTDDDRLKVENNESYLNTKIYDLNQVESGNVGLNIQIGIEEIIEKYL